MVFMLWRGSSSNAACDGAGVLCLLAVPPDAGSSVSLFSTACTEWLQRLAFMLLLCCTAALDGHCWIVVCPGASSSTSCVVCQNVRQDHIEQCTGGGAMPTSLCCMHVRVFFICIVLCIGAVACVQTAKPYLGRCCTEYDGLSIKLSTLILGVFSCQDT